MSEPRRAPTTVPTPPLPPATEAQVASFARQDLANWGVLLYLAGQIGGFVFLGTFVFNWRQPLDPLNLVFAAVAFLMGRALAVSQQRATEQFLNAGERITYYRRRAREGKLGTMADHARSWGGLYLIAVIVFGLTIGQLWDQPFDLATLGLLIMLNWGTFQRRLSASLARLNV